MKLIKLALPSVLTVATLAAGGLSTGAASAMTPSGGDWSSDSHMSSQDWQKMKDMKKGTPVTDESVLSAGKSAIMAKWPDAMVKHMWKMDDGTYGALVKNDGMRVWVAMDSNYMITDSKEMPKRYERKDNSDKKDWQKNKDDCNKDERKDSKSDMKQSSWHAQKHDMNREYQQY